VDATFDSHAPRARLGAATHVARGTLDAIRALLPQACQLCAAAAGSALVCPRCADALPRIGPACPRCALPSAGSAVCGACLARDGAVSRTIAPFRYAHPVDRLLQRLKYARVLALADWAADALAGAAGAAVLAPGSGPIVDALVPLPLSAARMRERGFNQSREIARGVSSRLDVPLADVLERIRDGPPQASLAWDARARNVRGAFRASPALRGRTVAVLDDVMTTGTTLGEAARALSGAGALRVEAWVVARTLPPGADA